MSFLWGGSDSERKEVSSASDIHLSYGPRTQRHRHTAVELKARREEQRGSGERCGRSYEGPRCGRSYEGPRCGRSYEGPRCGRSYEGPRCGRSYEGSRCGRSYEGCSVLIIFSS
ncbi:hypothetical protein EYF80_066955 [Liparis tanakae]|uniref:Uncharacterized protein n=1 Tax=Liparis tanakae TaxID=230148 RepID=A0A4Z2E2D0_9TELE|nr:hypothetical protein EYF80_066955 [Liparis tanakae]